MELIAGESLSDRLRRAPLELTEVLAIARQIAAGLEAAHRGGIVHRDLKPSNVMLMTGPTVRAVVTDFGLAREEIGAPGSGDRFVGTTEYMAPEQVEGTPAGPAADVYALGLILFEMVTGRRAFVGATRMATAVLRLTEPPPSPSTIVPDLPAAWTVTIERCLARHPEDRFPSAAELERALIAREAQPSKSTAQLGSWMGRWGRPGAILATVAIAGSVIVWRSRPADPPDRQVISDPPATVAPFRRVVAVIGLHDLAASPDSAWRAIAATELLEHELGAGEAIRVVPTETVEQARRELALPDHSRLDAHTLGRIQHRLGCEWVVTGSVIAEATTLRVDVELADARSGESLVTVTETGSPTELLELVTRVGTRMRVQLGLPAVAASARAELRAQQPTDPEAARLYAEALVHSRASDYLGAKERLLRAITLEPTVPLTHSMLASILADSGSIDDARRQAALASEHAAGLPREERLRIEAA